MNDLIKDENGLVKTGEYTSVNPNFMSTQGLQSARSFAGIPSTITSEYLSGTPTPINLKSPEPLTGADGLLGMVETGANNWMTDYQTKSQQNQELAKIKTEMEASKQSIREKLFGSKGEVQMTDEVYSQTVDPLESELKAINQDILLEQNSLRKQIEGLDNQPGTIEQKQQREYDLKKESAKYQADLYIKQMGIQGRYDSAKAIADRKIAVALEKDKRDLELLKWNYEENKEIFTKEEQRMFETAQADRERALDAKQKQMETFENTRLALLKSANEQNAPLQVKTAIASARTTEEAIQAAGQWAGDVLERQIKQAQLAKLIEEAKTTSTGGKLTAAQQTALSYAQRVNDSNAIIDEVGGQFTGVGSYLGQYAPNALKSADRQKFEQAQRNFINAVLRRESGAAIAESEFDSARKQYFPQPGDSIDVLEQKKMNRERTLENLLREGGQNIAVVNQSKDPLGIGVGANPLGI
jgi:hypothetical protein